MATRVASALGASFLVLLLLLLSGQNPVSWTLGALTSWDAEPIGTDHKEWDILNYLGGNGPWIKYRTAHESPVEELPLNCKVDQAHMISRHAERYPTANAGSRHLALLKRLQAPGTVLTGPLAFVADWTYFTDVDNPAFENLTESGPYAGTTQATNTGHELRQRYTDLVNSNKTTKFWTCSSPRDVATARNFANGFFGKGWEDAGTARMLVIPEEADRGGNTLTPGDTCLRYINDLEHGHDGGYAKLKDWQAIFTKPISKRLLKHAGNQHFEPIEIYSMMEMCGFEILARGSSPWCSVFTRSEWQDFAYGRDLLHFYRAGPGNPYAGSMGSLWLEATTKLLTTDDAAGVYLSFVHDGDIIPLLATLGIMDEPGKVQDLPSRKHKSKRKWRTSDVVPMGGRLIFERVTCKGTGIAQNLNRSYVRLFINDGPFNLKGGSNMRGLTKSLGMTSWIELVRRQREKFGSFATNCGLSEDSPTEIMFLQPQYT